MSKGLLLIVEDDSDISSMLQIYFESQGYESIAVSRGEEALEIIVAQKPALVYLDLMMPRVGGLDVCRAVKGELGLQDIYVVMLTAMGQQMDMQKAQEAGADLYLTKPFDPDTILSIAQDVLSL